MKRFFSFAYPPVKRECLPVIISGFFLLQCFFGLSNDIVPVSIDSVDYHRIVYKKVRKLVYAQKKLGIHAFNEMHTVCINAANSSDFRTYKKTKLIRQNIQIVWKNFTKLPMKKQMEGRIVKLDLLVSKNINSITYNNDITNYIEVGQILFFNLRLLDGLKNIGVAMEVTDIDYDKMKVEYCYLDHGLTKGTQEISLKATPEGYTEITHLTRYKCRSWLRNNVLYDIFHGQVVKEFLSQMKARSENHQLILANH